MELLNRFTVAAPLDLAWAGLLDIPLVVDCLPGATLTETVGPSQYKGLVRVRLGPIAMEFAGVLDLELGAPGSHTMTVKGAWTETKNRGSATSVSRIAATAIGSSEPPPTDVQMQTDVQLAGQIAQYGRGVGIIAAVSAELVKQFAANLQAALAERQAAPATAPELSIAAPSPLVPAPAISSAPTAVARGRPKEISTLSLLWSLLKARLRSLLSHA
jgi:carbon monoxide dehydrogenase subunit G